ncbi:MAG: hypothetical protein IPO88_08345 [Nannocystis sp.]|uniref:hypothetical protein n=1 Tax=Nannocystis sp. TaxID=1962667 RepID=UPI002428A67C|nr:hypothetical protein [Nannocystis sp.]MBK9753501.1 hypothetical protein [Nannocystis sp.]
MKTTILYPSLALLAAAAAALALPVDAAAETCSVPPSGAMSLSDSRDDIYVGRWCSSQSTIDSLWNGLSLDANLWDEGWGYDNVCDPQLFLPRLLNAAFNVTKVQEISRHFGENNAPARRLWWDFVKEREGDGYEPKCCNDEPGLNAAHFCCGYSTNLCVKWAYKIGAAVRSSTLVHEATHEDEGHVGDDECMNGGSCDTHYGAYNANTMQINYLYDAVSAYQIETVNGNPQRKVTRFTSGATEMCAYIPLWNDAERGAGLDQISYRLNNNFASGSVFPKYSDVDSVDNAYGASWTCANCDVSKYTFSLANLGKNKACNEIANKANAGVNAANRALCSAFNGKIAKAPGAAGYQTLANELYLSTKSCLLYNPADLDAYCSAQQAKAKTVSELDPYGILASNGFEEELECAADYCRDRFDLAWQSHSSEPTWDDPLGCLDMLCDDDTECRRRFLVYKADPKKYHPDHCNDVLLDCIEASPQTAQKTAPQWRGGMSPALRQDAVNASCQSSYKLCRATEEMARRVAAMVLIERWGPPGPGPVEDLRTNPRVNPVDQSFRREFMALAARQKAGLSDAQFTAELEALMRHPEAMAATFDASPATFAALFGQQDFTAIVGPQLARVSPSFAAAEQIPAAKALLPALNQSRASFTKLGAAQVQKTLQEASIKLTPEQFAGVLKGLDQANTPAQVEAALAKAGP